MTELITITMIMVGTTLKMARVIPANSNQDDYCGTDNNYDDHDEVYKDQSRAYNIIAVEQQHWLWGGVWANNGNDKMDNNSNDYHMYLK